MLETLLALITAHLLADFPLQGKKLLDKKKNSKSLFLHTSIVTATTLLIVGSYDPRILVTVAATHAAMDYVKVHLLDDGIKSFAADQLFHLLVLITLSAWLPQTASDGWIGRLSTPVQLSVYKIMVLTSALIMTIMVGGMVITKMLARFGISKNSTNDQQNELGIPGGGEYIGWLERGLTLLFLLIDQPEGIGLMLAAKSVLRFSDKNARTHTEYVIIGTLLSFGWAIVFGIAAKLALAHWS